MTAPPNPLIANGWTNQGPNLEEGPAFANGFYFGLLAATPVAGFALVNGTPTILSWTAPNDGKMHRYQIFAQQHVTSDMTGGELAIVFTSVDGTVETQQFSATSLTSGMYGPSSFSWQSGLIEAGSTITLEQFSAMTVGACTFWAEIWGS